MIPTGLIATPLAQKGLEPAAGPALLCPARDVGSPGVAPGRARDPSRGPARGPRGEQARPYLLDLQLRLDGIADLMEVNFSNGVGVGDGQGRLACRSPCNHKESDVALQRH